MSVLYSPTLNYSGGERRRNPEMDSNIGNLQLNCHKLNSGLLLRYRSAPSSLLESLDDTSSHGCVNEEAFRGEDDQHRYLPSSSSPEMETLLAKLVSSNTGWINSASCSPEFGGKPVKQEKAGESVSNSYGSPQLIYQSQQIQGFPNGSLSSGNGFDGTFSALNSMVSENSSQSKMGPRNSSNLIRQKSSPAGLFNNCPVQNGFAGWREMGSFRACDASNGQASTSASGLNGTLTFSSRPSSCSSQLPDIAENGNESCVESARNLEIDNGTTNCYMPSFRSDFWDGASAFNDQKPASDNDQIMFSTPDAFETQNADFGYQKLGLAHHLSLPSSSSKMGAMEKLLQIPESVPCKIRAKRGFATHPRSIAERVRRTKISERIKKLQELFPKSDKQTSTADMLDLAVDYIKDLQNQVKILTDSKENCKCSSNQKQN